MQIKHSELRALKTVAASERLFFLILLMEQKTLWPLLNRYNPEQCILVIWEPPTIMPYSYDKNLHTKFNSIFTMWDELIIAKKYRKLYYPHGLNIPQLSIPFEQKKLCAMIYGNKNWLSQKPFINLYQKRKELINFFEQFFPDRLDLYGSGWDARLNIYKGIVPNKKACLQHYKFAIAYENTGNMAGYITEKIFDCMSAGAVPIYWGAQNITDYIPKNCFIDARDFATIDALYNYLDAMQKDEYMQFCDAIKAFLVSSQAQLFSHDNFVRNMVQAFTNENI